MDAEDGDDAEDRAERQAAEAADAQMAARMQEEMSEADVNSDDGDVSSEQARAGDEQATAAEVADAEMAARLQAEMWQEPDGGFSPSRLEHTHNAMIISTCLVLTVLDAF